MSALKRSQVDALTIVKNGNSVDISPPRTIAFQYYESLFSPVVTANLLVVDTGIPAGNSVSSSQNKQQISGTLLSSLPITGNEIMEFKFTTKLGKLDFQKFPLRVDGAPGFAKESNRESYAISLISPYSFVNEKTAVYKKYTHLISESVLKILREQLKVPQSRINIDPTENTYNFNGNSKNPFFILFNLAAKSVSLNEKDPGYFFYETQNGFNFRSISSLISKTPQYTYRQTSVLRDDDPQSDFKILSMTQTKNQSILSALKSGVYSSRNIFFDPRTFKYDEVIIRLREKKLNKYLGKQAEIAEDFDDFTRTHYHILDIGSLDDGISIRTNNDPKRWQAEATTRYNLLFNQVVQINVPCNPNLVAGDVINCDFQYVTLGDKNISPFDEHLSGKYLILHLCHSFDLSAGGKSITSLTLVRDTYGKYTK
jgi:hypothetical protein